MLVDAIDITLRAIQHRTKLYRNLVACVGGVSLASLLLAAVLHQWRVLSGLIILVPLTGGFLFRDSRLVCRWRNGILEMARSRGLDVAMFRKTISGFRQLPPHSLQAMLSNMSTNSQAAPQQTQPSEAALVDEYAAREQKDARRVLYATVLLTCALLCLAAGLSSGSVTLLLLGGSMGALVIALARIYQRG